MAKIYANSMITRAGIVEITDNGELLYRYQAPMKALKRTQYGDNRDYTVQPGDTWPAISLRFLGSAELWWIIAEFNRILDPFESLVPGVHLVIPSPTRVRLGSLSELE